MPVSAHDPAMERLEVPPDMDAVLQLSSVSKNFGQFLAVADASFSVPRGVIFGLLGPNGAGKTTLLRMINDILRPDTGEIAVFGNLAPGRAASRRIGYLPEERGLYPKMRVCEALRFFARLRGMTRHDAKRCSDAWLERLGIADWRNKQVLELSKGMQQKVQFATALLHDPELLILDEPWSGLDPINAEVLREIVLEQRGLGRTVLFSTHLMEQAEKICDHVCIVARGRVVLDGNLQALKRSSSWGRRYRIAVDDQKAARPVLDDRSFVVRYLDLDECLEVELAPEASADEFLARLVGASALVRSFWRHEPTLHDIFVAHVGQKASATMTGRLS